LASDARNRLAVIGCGAAAAEPRGETVTVALPGDHQRWRCGGCGNLTRFDVARSRRTTEFWHFDLAGDHEVEDSAVREEVVEAVTCRWCGRDDAIEVVDRAGADVAGSPGT
jgi:hypothetical protein